MHVLPPEFPLHAFVGYQVVEVLEVNHSVTLALRNADASAGIDFEGPGIFTVGEVDQPFDNEHLLKAEGTFRRLLGTTVVGAKRCEGPSSEFQYSDGSRLRLFDNVGGYESYHLRIDGDFCDV